MKKSSLVSVVAMAVLVSANCGGGSAPQGQSVMSSVPSAASGPAQATDVAPPVAAVVKGTVTVYKSPTCGCCEKWVEYMRTNGFVVKTMDVEDVDVVKQTYGVPASVQSCHTALVGGYVVEGHVPAEVVSRMLQEKPAIVGIAVGGMPVGSPGMEVPQGIVEPYVVSSFDKKGQTAVYERR